MEIPKEVSSLWKQLSQFVAQTCKGRDDSHGHRHMERVATNSLYIFLELYGEIDCRNINVAKMVIVSAWLHDVADHKYDRDGRLKIMVKQFLMKVYQGDREKVNLIIDIIDRVSFSKEKKSKDKNIKLDWNEKLGSTGTLVRNIVSDADKLEAIGEEGVKRCINYTVEKHKERTGSIGMDYDNLVNEVKTHAQEKLLKLKDEYIRTKPGKAKAQPLHNEMVEALNNL